VLLSDTVGFLRNLPHALVTSFRATLEEVERAELLLHVRDAASPTLDAQRQQVEAVLTELDVGKKPTLQVLNKIDLLPEGVPTEAGALRVSAALTADPLAHAVFRIPQAEGRVLAALERGATVQNQRFEGNEVTLTAIGPRSLLDRYRRYEVRSESSGAEAPL
jgi:GTP-binding protein HflX